MLVESFPERFFEPVDALYFLLGVRLRQVLVGSSWEYLLGSNNPQLLLNIRNRDKLDQSQKPAPLQ